MLSKPKAYDSTMERKERKEKRRAEKKRKERKEKRRKVKKRKERKEILTKTGCSA